MSTRKRKPADKKFAAFKLTREEGNVEENDLKKVKEQILKDLEANKENDKEWYDKELEKNMKNIK